MGYYIQSVGMSMKYFLIISSFFLKSKKSSNVSKFIRAMLLSKSASPLLKIEVTIKVFCLGILPMIVSTPDGDIRVISSPILRSKLKLSSFPIDIKSLSNVESILINQKQNVYC